MVYFISLYNCIPVTKLFAATVVRHIMAVLFFAFNIGCDAVALTEIDYPLTDAQFVLVVLFMPNKRAGPLPRNNLLELHWKETMKPIDTLTFVKLNKTGKRREINLYIY